MVSRFASASVSELESVLETLFENVGMIPVKAAPGVYFAHDPVIGHLFVTGEDHSALRLTICKALVAAARFRAERPPGWPDLPLRQEEIQGMTDSDCIRCNIVGYFGASLRGEGWSPRHPGFDGYVSGLLANPAEGIPDEIYNDSSLRREFPPHPLEGMCGLYWSSPESLAQDRRMLAMVAAAQVGV
jgi:hypothetical protein